jgi:hypothetical protein
MQKEIEVVPDALVPEQRREALRLKKVLKGPGDDNLPIRYQGKL